MFRDQAGKLLTAVFHQNNMEGIRNVMRKNNTWIIVLVMFYETKTKKTIKSYIGC